jgi:hypothetical protein
LASHWDDERACWKSTSFRKFSSTLEARGRNGCFSNGKDVPPELRELPAGRYVVEAVDEKAPALSQEDFCERREHINDRRSHRRGSTPAMNCAKSSSAASRAL